MKRKAPKQARFIQAAISHPGALTDAVGGPPGQNLAKVEDLLRNGTPEQQRQAAFFIHVLHPLNKAAKKRGKR